MVQSLYRRGWTRIAAAMSLSHSLPLLIDEIELCLIANVVALATSHTIGFKVSLVACFALHLLRGGYRWQMSPLYLSVLVFFGVQGYATAVKVVQIICTIATIALCYIIPSIPLMDGRGKALGVQDLTFDGPAGKFWVRCFYPTRGSVDKPETANFPTQSKLNIKTLLSVGTISLSVAAILYLEVTDSAPSLQWFSIFGVLHFLRLVYDMVYGLPSVAYISKSEFPSVLFGLSAFSTLPSVMFSHMSQMRINCTQDAPVHSVTGKMKVAFVLHGLGGTRCVYSFICMRLAAEGYFVIAPEFGDGTACMSHLPDGVKRQYKAHSHLPGEIEASEANLKFRRDQLEHRSHEMEIIVRYFTSLGAETTVVDASAGDCIVRWNRQPSGASSYFLDSLSSKLGKHNPTVSLDIRNPFIVGHSFGGVNAVHVQRSPDKLAAQFRSAVDSIAGIAILDPWMWPLLHASQLKKVDVIEKQWEGEDSTMPPAPVTINSSIDNSIPYLVMHTEYFQWPSNMDQERSLVRAVRHVMHLRILDAGHNNFSDTGFLAPLISGQVMKPKKTGMQDPVPLQELINDMLTAFLSDCQTNTPPCSSATATAAAADSDKKEGVLSLNKCLSLAQETKCFEVLEARW